MSIDQKQLEIIRYMRNHDFKIDSSIVGAPQEFIFIIAKKDNNTSHNSLNDKLKKTMIEMEPETQQTCLFPYTKPLPNAAIVTVHKHDLQNTLDSAQLQNLSKK